MKKSLVIVLFACIAVTTHAQEPAKLIVRGDDMGYTHSGNEALIKCYKEGIVRSIEVIVPSPWFPEAVVLLNENPGVDVGIHLTLTSEWDLLKWRPLTDVKSLKDQDGYFFPMVFPNVNYPKLSIIENPWKIEDIEKEFRAQIELALKKIPRISHISDHMWCAQISDEVKSLTRRLAEEYKMYINTEDNKIISVNYDGPSKTREEKISSFITMLNKLESGKTYLFLDHPGFDNAELRAVYHIGYEHVSGDRQGVTDLFTSGAVKECIKKNKIQLISYADIAK